MMGEGPCETCEMWRFVFENQKGERYGVCELLEKNEYTKQGEEWCLSTAQCFAVENPNQYLEILAQAGIVDL